MMRTPLWISPSEETRMPKRKQRLMKSSEIPDYVADIIAAGCDICAVGHDSYVAGDIGPERGGNERVAADQ
jgi:hypothetical protein